MSNSDPAPLTASFADHVAEIQASPGWVRPSAYGLGLATYAPGGDKVLDTYYATVNLDENLGVAALLADVTGASVATGTRRLTAAHLDEAIRWLADVVADGAVHRNADALIALRASLDAPQSPTGSVRAPVVTFINSLEEPPVDTHDVYLRLHLLSHRKVPPHGLNLDGQFGLLNNVVWTNLGPVDPDGFEAVRTRLRSHGTPVQVTGVDKFPRMTDYVIPSGVRVAHADRVRLGAHLAEGTTVMHEGFVNFNAGTLGSAMVEGRISAGVVIGDHTDLGGGASIMGTLSGGGKEVISIGDGSLIGANAGVGISLGDGCTVEAGLYVTAGTIVTLPDGSTTKARELSGRDGLLFRRNSRSGAVEVLSASVDWGGLNAELHAND